MCIHISWNMYLRLGLHLQISLNYVLTYKTTVSAQHGIGFILDRCIVYLGLTMPNLQKKWLLIFEIFNIKKRTLFFLCVYLGLTMQNLQEKRLPIFEIFNIKKCTLFYWNRVYRSILLFQRHSLWKNISLLDRKI